MSVECVGKSYTADTLDSAMMFLKRQAAMERNLYWSPNAVRDAIDKKPRKSDIRSMRYVHLDHDDASDEALEAIQNYRLPPTLIVFSGGGYNVYWKLLRPIKANGNIAELEAANAQVMLDLHAERGTHNLDRILRLPGTVNYPTKAKLKRGRVPVEAYVVEDHPERTYTLDQFDAGAEAIAIAEGKGKPAPAKNRDADTDHDESRSAALMRKVSADVEAGMTPDEIHERYDTTDPHAQDQADPTRAVQRCIDKAQAAQAGTLGVVQELNRSLAFILHESKAGILKATDDPDYPGTQKIVLSRVQDIKHDYANQFYEAPNSGKGKKVILQSKFELWMHHPQRRRLRRLVLIPGGTPGYDPKTTDWNLWQGWGVVAHEPDAEHSWKKLRMHIRKVVACGNAEYATYIIDWLAYCVQHPAEMPEVALVLRGGEGAGKGIIFNSMVKLFGRHGMHLSSQRQLVGNFNAHLKDKLFIFGDEVFYAGDKASGGALKALITEARRVIEPKFIDAYELPNFSKIGMATNETWAVPADIDARRFAIFDVSTERVSDFEYFEAIGAQLSNGGYGAMLWDLQHRDLSNFDPRNYPQTKALFDQKKLTFDPITAWWFERLCEGKLKDTDSGWSGAVSRSEVQAEIAERNKLTSHELRSLETKVGIRLRILCPKLVECRRRIGDRRIRTHTFPDLATCRAAFATALRMTEDQINWKTGEQKIAVPQEEA
jgi:hypothetical protein